MENYYGTKLSNYKVESILGHADTDRFVKSRRISWLVNGQSTDDFCMQKFMAGRNEDDQ